MAERVKYSVIVPVFNREQTLARCLESLTAQDRKDVQIIVIDDGSDDRSGQIALEYAKKYQEVQYCYQENAGVSQARNYGLDLASGEYVSFVDSDDYVSENYFSVLDQATERNEWDLLVFRAQGFGAPAPNEAPLFAQLAQTHDSFQRLELLLSSRLIMHPVNKCFKNKIIQAHHLRFMKNLHIGEDFVFCMTYVVHCFEITTEQTCLYYVDLSDQNSLSRKYRPQLDEALNIVFLQVKKTIENGEFNSGWKGQLLTITDYLYIKNVFSCISEEFKQRRLHYFRDRKRIAEICEKFQQPISHDRCGIVHWALRLVLKWRLYFPFYFVSYVVKGRKYR